VLSGDNVLESPCLSDLKQDLMSHFDKMISAKIRKTIKIAAQPRS